MTLELWTLAIALVTAVACAFCGVLLLVKRESLVSEGLSHAVLPGIVIAFVIWRDRSSPLLIVSAGLMGLVMVLLMRAINRTRLVDNDASLGIVFAALFSIGIILANQEIRNTHFHAHCIIDGNLSLAPLDTLKIGDTPIAPRSFVVMASVLLVISIFLIVFYKELKLMLFDQTLADSLGFRPTILHVAWLALVSITTVAAFETAGSVLVVALMITPPAAAYLLTDRLRTMLFISAGIGVASAVGGFYLGLFLDISPTGPMSFMSGALFLATLLFAPKRGLISRWKRLRLQQASLYQHLLLLKLTERSEHEDADEPMTQSPGVARDTLMEDLSWTLQQTEDVLSRMTSAAFIQRAGDQLQITQDGRNHLHLLESRLN